MNTTKVVTIPTYGYVKISDPDNIVLELDQYVFIKIDRRDLPKNLIEEIKTKKQSEVYKESNDFKGFIDIGRVSLNVKTTETEEKCNVTELSISISNYKDIGLNYTIVTDDVLDEILDSIDQEKEMHSAV